MFTDEERAFIDKQRVAHLATADTDGSPHVVPIVYALVEGSFYFVIDEKPKKSRHNLKRLRNIAVNPRVAVVIDRYDEDWSRLGYLLVRGEATVVTNDNVYARVLEELRRRYPQYRQMSLKMDTNPMVGVAPFVKHFWLAAAV
jgi:PPOX class probable F420-dependent enzyme